MSKNKKKNKPMPKAPTPPKTAPAAPTLGEEAMAGSIETSTGEHKVINFYEKRWIFFTISLAFIACGIIADETDENTPRAKRRDVARDIARAADIEFAAPCRDHRRRRFRRDARDFAIDEFVQHQIADAQHGLADNRLRQRIKVEHENAYIPLPDQR